MSWSARQYTAFEKERTRPVRDLVAALPQEQIQHAVDLGCGPGNSTEVLAERYPGARVGGLDSSEDMIQAARQRLPDITFELANIDQWAPTEPLDLILANASLQWLPDHDRLYPRLVGYLQPGGSLAIQTPDNLQEPAHRLARELAAQGPRASRTASVQHPPRHSAEHYYDILSPHCRHVDLWRTTYYHPLEGGAQAVVEWFKGSALRPYLDVLAAPEQAAFLEAYRQAMEQAYPVSGDGKVLLPFPRLFIVATR